MGNASMNNTSHPFMAFSHPWAQAIAQKDGRVVRGGLIFDQGVGKDVAKDFLGQLDNGAIKAGKQLGNGQYVFTGGESRDKDWKQYSPGDDYERIVSLGGVYGSGTGRNDGWVNHQFDRDPVQVWRRKESATPPPGPGPDPDPEDPVDPTPRPPADQVDASNPSLADALKSQNEQSQQWQQRPALQDALNSALRLNGQDAQERPAAEATDSSSTDQQQGEDRADRRYAASDRWRKRLAEATGRLSQPMA